MTPIRKHSVLRRVKDITLGTTLTLALLNGSVLLQSCGSNQEQSEAYEQTTSSPGQGVRTYITETSPGNFRITDEVQVDPGQAGAIVSYFDGHRDTLGVEAARRLVQADPATSGYFNNPAGYGGPMGGGLANALLWGGLGYMIGRSTAPSYRDRDHRYSSRYYANPGLHNRSTRLREDLYTRRTNPSYGGQSRATRPSNGRSGFFGGRSRGFSS